MCFVSNAQKKAFIENLGQWDSNFSYKLPLSNGGVFISPEEVVYKFKKYEEYQSLEQTDPEDPHGTTIPYGTPIKGHAYKVNFLNANSEAKSKPEYKLREYHNYLQGKDPSKWKSKVGLFKELNFQEIYSGVDVRYYFNNDENLKYDVIVKAGSDPSQVQLSYEGTNGLKLSFGNLIVKTSLDNVLESAPYAYQIIKGETKEVKCKYQLQENIVSFKLGSYDEDYDLIIDPVLIFSTYSGSSADNFGFTATYGEDGLAYGGGIVYDNGQYPVSLGAFLDTFYGGVVDVGITKYLADGSDIVYSTYLGGNSDEVPHSIIEGADKELIIVGSTGSLDFPTTMDAYDTSFTTSNSVSIGIGGTLIYSQGAELFVTRLDSTGGVLKGSTFFGGNSTDGVNLAFSGGSNYNYGDINRGDVALDSLGNVFVVSSSYSSDLPNAGGHTPTANLNDQDGIIFSLSPDLSSLNWCTYLAGQNEDALLSLKVSGGDIYAAGTTNSPDLGSLYTGGFEPQQILGEDGFLIKLNKADGSVLNFTYNGTTAQDGNFLLDLDKDGNVYTLGQTRGNYPVLGTDVFSQNNGSIFINKFNADLSNSLLSTTIGDNNLGRADFSPTALMVDICGNVYVSGWGSQITTAGSQVLPVTNNSGNVPGARVTSDGQDFYFMVLDASWEKINFGAYFGVLNSTSSGDHVDGGTSRFQKDGTIYQAVCAGCGGSNAFPTSDSAYAKSNGASGGLFGCNMAVIKMQMEIDVLADFEPDIDSSCIPYTVSLLNRSYNADIYEMMVNGANPISGEPNQLTIDQTGQQSVSIVAIDTSCGLSDTITLNFYGYEDPLEADFAADNDTCNGSLNVNFQNTSLNADNYFWDFGDGTFSWDKDPSHQFAKDGTYNVQLIASGGDCGGADTLTREIKVKNIVADGSFFYIYDPCIDGKSARFQSMGSGFEHYIWSVNGQEIGDSAAIQIEFPELGVYTIQLQSLDSSCARYITSQQTININNGSIDLELPNVFTPNEDGENDYFGLSGEFQDDFFQNFNLRVFSRWGGELFSAASFKESWDGNFEGEIVPQGVYYYVLDYEDSCGNTKELTGFVHLFR